MTTIILQFFLAALAIILAGTLLAKSADKIAHVTGLGGLFVGGIFLAAATSLPELMVDLSAIRQGRPNMAVGDLFGSSLFNLLILGVVDLMHTKRGLMFSRTSMAHALAATQSIAMTGLAAIGIILAPHIGEYAIAGLSYGTLAILIAYLLGLRLVFEDQRFTNPLSASIDSSSKSNSLRKALLRPLAGYFSGAVVILIAAPYLADAAGKIADASGLGNTFIGTSLVALCTSMPELVASIAAVRMGSFDLALGNIFGSNAFNMVLLVPLDFVSDGPLLMNVSQTHILTAVAAIVITAVAVMGQLYQVEKRKTFVEPDAFLVIGLVVATQIAIFYLG